MKTRPSMLIASVILPAALLTVQCSAPSSNNPQYQSLVKTHIKTLISSDFRIINIQSIDRKPKIRTGSYYVKVMRDDTCFGIFIKKLEINHTGQLSLASCAVEGE